MGDYTSRIDIDRPAAEVFAFIADIRHMPAFLPMVRTATPQGDGRVVVEGATNGRHFRSDGWLRSDAQAMTVEWGSDDENDYHGRLRVSAPGPVDGHTPGARIEIDLHLTPGPQLARRLKSRAGDVDRAVREAIDAALGGIKSLCEGTGIMRRPTVAERRAAQAAAADDAARGGGLRAGDARPDDDRRPEDGRPLERSATLNTDL